MNEEITVFHRPDRLLQKSEDQRHQAIVAFLDEIVISHTFAGLDVLRDLLNYWADYAAEKGLDGEKEDDLYVAVINGVAYISAGHSPGGEFIVGVVAPLKDDEPTTV